MTHTTPASNGGCPQCGLAGSPGTPMLLNTSDFWECPGCRLQAHTACVGVLTLLRTRGRGEFRPSQMTASSQCLGGLTLAGAGEGGDGCRDSLVFEDMAGLKDFLQKVEEGAMNDEALGKVRCRSFVYRRGNEWRAQAGGFNPE